LEGIFVIDFRIGKEAKKRTNVIITK